MAKMSHGPRAGSRMKMRKRVSEKGFPKVNDLVRKFEIGDLAAIKINSSVHDGMPAHNFQGYTGRIVGTQGSAYVLSIKVGSVEKKIIATPVHLKKISIAGNPS